MNKFILCILYNILCVSCFSIYSAEAPSMGLGFAAGYKYPFSSDSSSSEKEDMFFAVIKKYIRQTTRNTDNRHDHHKKSRKKNIHKGSSKHKFITIVRMIAENMQNIFSSSEKDVVNDIKQLHDILKDQHNNIKTQFDTELNSNNNNIPLNMFLLVDALFLNAKTEEELNNNRKLGKQLAVKFHPDKMPGNDADDSKTNFFKHFKEPLLDDKRSERLDKMLDEINKALQNYLYPPATKTDLCLDLATRTAISIGTMAAHIMSAKITEHLAPTQTLEKKSEKHCTQNIQHVAYKLALTSLAIQSKQLQQFR